MKKTRPYEKLKFYQDICELRKMVYELTKRFEKLHLRLVSQMRDSARSSKQNIREGYRKGSLGEYAHSVRISQGSLEELTGDIEDCRDDGLITEKEFNDLSKLCRSANYLSNQYLKSLHKIGEDNWTKPGFAKRKKCNLKQPKATFSNIKQPSSEPPATSRNITRRP